MSDAGGDVQEPDAEPGSSEPRGPASGAPAASGALVSDAATRRRREGWVAFSGGWVERTQDVISVAVAVALIGLAASILVAAVYDFFTSAHRLGLAREGTRFLDDVLLVLILVEVVHTVVLSLRAHALVAQPFLVVGLVAVIRKILFTLGGEQKVSTATLGLYIGMVAVFVVSLVVIQVIGKRPRHNGPSDGLTDTI